MNSNNPTKEEVYATPEQPAAMPLIFNPSKCTGCNRCLEACQVDILLPNPEAGQPPIVQYPGECWYCGCCVMECSQEGALTLKHPLMNQVRWVRKTELGEKDLGFRI